MYRDLRTVVDRRISNAVWENAEERAWGIPRSALPDASMVDIMRAVYTEDHINMIEEFFKNKINEQTVDI